MTLARHIAQVDGHLTIVDFAQTTAPLPSHPDRLPPGLGKRRGIEDQHAIGLAQVLAHLAPQRVSQGGLIPVSPADKTLQPQAVLAKMIRDRFHVLAFDVREQASDIGLSMRPRGLPLQGVDKGCHKGAQAGHNLREDLRCALTFLKQLRFSNDVSGVHGSAPSGAHTFVSRPQKEFIHNDLEYVNEARQSNYKEERFKYRRAYLRPCTLSMPHMVGYMTHKRDAFGQDSCYNNNRVSGRAM